MASPSPAASVEAHIQGEISGQVAVGNYNVQIGSVHGGVVNVAPPQAQPTLRLRPTPVLLRPRPFRDLLDRETEIGLVTDALQAKLPVDLYGQAGLGKTSLLRHLAHHSPTTPFSDGIIFLSARHTPLPDLLQSLFDAFYESDVPFKPTDAQIRHGLQDKRALIILDDVGLARDEVDTLLDAAPACTFLLAATERRLWGEGRVIALRGLPLEQALELMERELGRSLTPQERPAAQALCTTLAGHPLHLLEAAALAREEGRSLDELARQVGPPAPAQALLNQQISSLSEPQQRVLAVLAALNGAPLSAEHLAALTGLTDVRPVVETLRQRSLLQAHSPRYSLTGPLNETLGQAWNLTPLAERALAHFTSWTEAHHTAPERLLPEAEAILQVLEWAFRAGRWREVLRLGRAIEGALALGKRWGAWHQVLQWTLQAAQALGETAAEAWALHQLGTRALCLGDASPARTSLIRALRLRESLGDRAGATVTRHNLNVLIGPPPPPRGPSETPAAPTPAAPVAPAVPLLLKLAPLLLLLGALGVWYFGLRPAPSAAPTLAPLTPTPTLTITPTPTGTPPPTTTLTSTPTSAYTPTPTGTPTPTPSPTPCATPPSDWRPYTVQAGDTLFKLACEDRQTLDSIIFYNCLQGTQIQAGQRLYLPPDLERPPAPILLEPQDGAEIGCSPEASVSVTLRWGPLSDCSGIARYEVGLVRHPYYPPVPVTSTLQVEGSQAQAIITGACEDSYDWRVRGVDGAGNSGDWSAWSSFRLRPQEPACADLVVYGFSGPRSARPGEEIGPRSRLVVTNQGDLAAGGFFVDIVISSDRIIDTSDQLLIGGREYVAEVAPGQQVAVDLVAQQIPEDWPGGQYHIGAILDSFDDQAECNEDNNTASFPISISPSVSPDLIVYAFSGPRVAQPGENISRQMSLIVTNQGVVEAGGFSVDFVISPDTVIDTSDRLLPDGRVYVDGIAPGEQVDVDLFFEQIPTDWPTGDFYIGAILDPVNSLRESNENNNTGFFPISVSDLAPEAVIREPEDGAYFQYEEKDQTGYYATVTLVGEASDQEDKDEELTVEWFSDVDGFLGSGRSITARLHAEPCGGLVHKITLRVTDSAGNVSEDTIVVTVLTPEC